MHACFPRALVPPPPTCSLSCLASRDRSWGCSQCFDCPASGCAPCCATQRDTLRCGYLADRRSPPHHTGKSYWKDSVSSDTRARLQQLISAVWCGGPAPHVCAHISVKQRRPSWHIAGPRADGLCAPRCASGESAGQRTVRGRRALLLWPCDAPCCVVLGSGQRAADGHGDAGSRLIAGHALACVADIISERVQL